MNRIFTSLAAVGLALAVYAAEGETSVGGTTDRLPGAGSPEMDTGGEGGKGRCGDKNC